MFRSTATQSFGTALLAKMKKDRITNGAAALAFYWMLALFPAAILGWLGASFGFSPGLLFFFAALRWVIIAGALLLALAVVYAFGPAVKERRFALFTPGTITGTAALALASVLFNVYVGHFSSYDRAYGSLGAVIALLMWLFVTGLVLLFGAEVDVLSQRRRSRLRPIEPMRGGAHPQPA